MSNGQSFVLEQELQRHFEPFQKFNKFLHAMPVRSALSHCGRRRAGAAAGLQSGQA